MADMKLKNCPFCKMEITVEQWGYSHDSAGACPLNAIAWTKDSKNFAAWNTRASDSTIEVQEAEIKRLRGENKMLRNLWHETYPLDPLPPVGDK